MWSEWIYLQFFLYWKVKFLWPQNLQKFKYFLYIMIFLFDFIVPLKINTQRASLVFHLKIYEYFSKIETIFYHLTFRSSRVNIKSINWQSRRIINYVCIFDKICMSFSYLSMKKKGKAREKNMKSQIESISINIRVTLTNSIYINMSG